MTVGVNGVNGKWEMGNLKWGTTGANGKFEHLKWEMGLYMPEGFEQVGNPDEGLSGR